MPKAELHLHLDGSLRPSTALELARPATASTGAWTSPRHAGRLDGADALPSTRRTCCGPSTCPSRCMQDAEALERITHELVEDVAADGTRYVEIRWAPSLHAARRPLPAGRHRGRGRGRPQRCGGRRPASVGAAHRGRAADPRPGAQRGRMARPAAGFRGDGLAGFDLAGREADAPTRCVPRGVRHRARRRAGHHRATPANGAAPRRSGVPSTLGPSRIAHGAPAADDPALMAELTRTRRDPRPVPHQQRPGGDRPVARRPSRWPGCIGPACR